MQLGKLVQAWRYPVKSMAGEAIAEVHLAPESGLAGDRGFAVIDVETGTVASAKHPKKWNQLLECAATWTGEGRVQIALPDGTRLDSTQPDLDARLSAAFGRAVRLSAALASQAHYEEYSAATGATTLEPLAAGARAGMFFDIAPIHLVTTSTLARLQELLPEARVDPARFRPNLVIETGEAPGFVENAWEGKRITLGDQVELEVTLTCPRCVMTTLAQGGLPADPAILRAAAEHNRQWCSMFGKPLATVGMYANVVRGGTIRVGDLLQTRVLAG